MGRTMEIEEDRLEGPDVMDLLREHLEDMYANSPPESVHALDGEALKAPGITFWCAREEGRALGCIALKELDGRTGEVKSLRTRAGSRGRGIGAALVERLLEEARDRGYGKLYLETGAQDFFRPAHRLYQRYGFVPCGPFGDYLPDQNSLFMELRLP